MDFQPKPRVDEREIRRRAEERKTLMQRLEKVHTVLMARNSEATSSNSLHFRLDLVNDGDVDLSFDDSLICADGTFTVTDEQGNEMELRGGSYGKDRLRPLYAHSSVVLFDMVAVLSHHWLPAPGSYKVMFNGCGLTLSGDLGDAQEGSSRDRVCVGGMPSNVVEIRITEEESTDDN